MLQNKYCRNVILYLLDNYKNKFIMDKKTVSIISYITIIGWVIAYFSYKNDATKPSLVRYHLKQGLGIAIVSILLSVVLNIVGRIVPTLASILSIANLGILILWILGIINAANEKETPVPLVGKMFEDKFAFLD
jgi:uncharacterized membrane protein